MIRILFKTDSHYTVDRKRLRSTIEAFLTDKRVKGNVEISVSVVGDRMMQNLNKQYRSVDATTDVLSFPLIDWSSSLPFVDPPDDILRLGDIVLSYPQAVFSASEEEKLVDDKIDELVIHGVQHLMGQHHDGSLS